MNDWKSFAVAYFKIYILSDKLLFYPILGVGYHGIRLIVTKLPQRLTLLMPTIGLKIDRQFQVDKSRSESIGNGELPTAGLVLNERI